MIAIYVGYPALFERPDLKTDTSFPFVKALKYTFLNRSYLTAAGAQAMRFFATGTMQAGMMFYMKYSLKVDPGHGHHRLRHRLPGGHALALSLAQLGGQQT